MQGKSHEVRKPDRIISYFTAEKWTLLIVAVTGILYNSGIPLGPWLEGKMAQCLLDIFQGTKKGQDMIPWAICYILVMLFVQGMRCLKRLYVRKFANHINRDMKTILYRNLVHKEKKEFESESVGSLMTKAISDVDACAEGMRKFTTEVFDTGVVMIAYLVMLLYYDWRLSLISLIFPPVAYIIAQSLKKTVTYCAAKYKESEGRLNEITLDRVTHALTYRVYGQEKNQALEYEACLKDYEKKAARANIWENAMQPIYRILSMTGVIMVLWFGAKNVCNTGWETWDIAAFTTFLSCYSKLAVKSSRAAKLFNAVQKAQVSWKRIKPYMKELPEEKFCSKEQAQILTAKNLGFSYPDGESIFKNVDFVIKPGEIVGVTGPVACGKSTFGKVFLGEYPYEGSLKFGREELKKLEKDGRSLVGYMGHAPELLSETVEENILLGNKEQVPRYLSMVCMEKEVEEMPEGIHTLIGNRGVRLSGGQQARIALARALCQERPVLVLDDPFSAVDQKTEEEIMEHLKEWAKDRIILIISHRLVQFPKMSQVFWMDQGKITVSDHKGLLEKNEKYREMYLAQIKGGDNIEKE